MSRPTKFLTALALSIGLAACGAYALDATEKLAAEAGARQFAERAGGTYTGCSGQDSDRDGYVTCEVKLPGATATVRVDASLLCSYKAASVGCKRKG